MFITIVTLKKHNPLNVKIQAIIVPYSASEICIEPISIKILRREHVKTSMVKLINK